MYGSRSCFDKVSILQAVIRLGLDAFAVDLFGLDAEWNSPAFVVGFVFGEGYPRAKFRFGAIAYPDGSNNGLLTRRIHLRGVTGGCDLRGVTGGCDLRGVTGGCDL